MSAMLMMNPANQLIRGQTRPVTWSQRNRTIKILGTGAAEATTKAAVAAIAAAAATEYHSRWGHRRCVVTGPHQLVLLWLLV